MLKDRDINLSNIFDYLCVFVVGHNGYKNICEHFVYFINNNFHESLKQEFEFLFGRWLNKNNDLKEPLSKFYRDIYEQVTDPHNYKPLIDKSEEESKEN